MDLRPESRRRSPIAHPLLRLLFIAALFCAAFSLHAQDVHTNPLNRTPEVRDAFQRFYIMDYDGALKGFHHIQSEHPDDPIATDYILYVTLFRELFRLDLLDTTFYANDGFLTGKHTVVEDPAARDQVKSLADKAMGQANVILGKSPNDVDALFARGWARSLEAAYMAMVQRSFAGGLKLALGAKNDNQHVLDLDPKYIDAKMVVGIYQYVVGALPLAFKLVIGIAGIHGSRGTGMEMLQDSAAHGVITSVESRTCMMLFLRREGKYGEAEGIAQSLAQQYPRDFLFNLEVANLSKDGGHGEEAIAAYEKILADAKRPGYYSSAHLELAYFGLGDTFRGQKRYAEAADTFHKAAAEPTTSPELKRRSLLAAGMNYDLLHDHNKASQQYQAVIDAGSDSAQADQAKKYMKDAYAGK